MTYINGFTKNAINISDSPIGPGNGESQLRTNSYVSDWKVEADTGYLYQNNQVLKEHQYAIVDGVKIEIFHAARLVYKKVRGNISHNFFATKGQTYTFTWLHIADMYYSESKHQNVSGSPEYHIHIALSTDKHLDNSNPVQQMSFFANDPDWVKKRFIFIAPESREYCISFQGKYDNSGIDRGAIITQINAYVGDEDDGSDPNKFRVISAAKELPLTQEENETNLNNHALHFTLQQQFGDDWKVPQARHQLRFDLTEGDNIIFDNDSLHYKITPSDEGKFTLPANCIKAKLVTADITKYMTVGLVGTDNSFKQIKKVGYSDFGFQNYVESKLPLTLKASASDKWTVDGTVPKSITEQQKISLQLKKNGKSLNAAEKLTIVLDPVGNLSVDSTTITTDDDGKFTITLTPNSGQSEHHITSLMLKLGENTVATYKIETGAAPAAKYDIKVYKDSDGKNPIDLNTVNTWTANTGHYVYVSVVKHGTSERVDTASINIAASPTTALVPLTSPVKIENGTPARVAFKPGTSASGNATITFSTTIDGQECLAELKVYLGESGSLEVVTPTPITLSPGIERTPSGDLAVLDVRFNPQVSGTVPEISFRVDGEDLAVLSEENIFVTDGVLKPADPKGNGDYRILPVLKTDKNASGPAKITFFIDKVKYPQEAAKWKQVTVTVNISSVDHVKWSVASGALVDTGSNPTVLKTGLKAYDSNGKEMSSYVMDVHIVTDDVDATFVDNTLTHRLTGPDSTGWARLPEMIVGQKTGKIHLQASLPGGGGYLKEELLLNVTAAQRPKDIVIHPNGVYPISWDDLDSGKFTHDSSRYAQLNDAGGHAIHSGKVTFTIADNTANARMATPDEVSTPTVKTVDVNANGRAFWPDIIIGNTTGAFTLTASNPDVIAAQTVKITVS